MLEPITVKFNNILVILNPENEKQYALERAIRLVDEQKNENKVQITVFMAVYDLSYQMSSLLSSEEREKMHHDVITEYEKAIELYLEKYIAPNIEYHSIVVWDNNEAEAISKEVEKDKYDLIVKYTQEEENLSSLIFTPIDWQLLRKCSTPIMFVKSGNWKHQKRILVAVNLSDSEEYHCLFNDELVSLGINLADILERGNIHLVTVYPPSPINMTIDLPEFTTADYKNNIRNQYLLNMKTLRQKFNIDEDHTHVKEGFPEDIIPSVAEEIGAEMVVLGTIGRTGISAAFLGNTAERVMRKLNCNLLTIKPSKK